MNTKTTQLLTASGLFQAGPLGRDVHEHQWPGDDGARLQFMGTASERVKHAQCYQHLGQHILKVGKWQHSNGITVLRLQSVHVWKTLVSTVCWSMSLSEIERQLRVVLVILVLMANYCIWVLEQPRQSLLGAHRRFNWLINHVCWVLWINL